MRGTKENSGIVKIYEWEDEKNGRIVKICGKTCREIMINDKTERIIDNGRFGGMKEN